MRLRTRLGALAVLGALTLTTAACGSDSDGAAKGKTDTTGAPGETTSAPAGDLPEKITIAYQAIPNGDLIVKQQGFLEEALPDVDIEWKLFDSGGSVNEAIAAGSVDFGLAGSSPVSRGISNGLPYKVIWIHDVIGKAESLVVRDDISSIQDLVGKKIATPFASTAHYSLLAALTDAGVDPSKVNIIDSEPDDIYAAWTKGDIDGAYVWNPNLAKLVAEGGKVLITSADLAEKGLTTYDLGVVATAFADKYPAAVQAWVTAQDKAVKILNSSPEDAAAVIGAELDLSADEALPQIQDLIFVPAAEQATADYLGGALAKALESAAKFNLEQGEIDKVADAQGYADAVDASFAKAVG